MSDPFTYVVEALWENFENIEEFTNLVKEQNRIKIDSKFKPLKSTIVESSVPEVCIFPAGKRLFEENPCNGASIVQVLHVTVASGVQNTSKIFPVEWAICQVLYTAINKATNSLLDLTWEDERFVTRLVLLPVEEGLTYDDQNRELKGWSAIFPIEVHMFFSRTMLGLED